MRILFGIVLGVDGRTAYLYDASTAHTPEPPHRLALNSGQWSTGTLLAGTGMGGPQACQRLE